MLYLTTHTNTFTASLYFKNKKIALPILVSSNHQCLAIINTSRKDLRGSKESITVSYMQTFLSYIEKYNKIHKHTPIELNNWKPIVRKHILQKDGYNCVAYILNFFELIQKSLPLTSPKCMSQYRSDLQHLLLQRTLSMIDRCLSCAVTVSSCAGGFRCIRCKRPMHDKCIKLHNVEVKKHTCSLCELY